MDLSQMLSDLNTYLSKAIPDTKLTIKKYADIKFEYLVSLSVVAVLHSYNLSLVSIDCSLIA